MMSVTHAQELVRETGKICLVPETCKVRVSINLVQVFYWYKFLACNRTHLYCSRETVRHVTWVQVSGSTDFTRLCRWDKSWKDLCLGPVQCFVAP